MQRSDMAPTRDARGVFATSFDLPDERVFDGILTAEEFRSGFGLHVTNARALQPFETEAMRKPGLVLHCFLEGRTEARLGGKPMGLGRRPGEPVRMVLTRTDQPELFWRRSETGEYVRKVNILLSHQWLEDNGLGLTQAGAGALRQNARVEWVASPEDVRIGEALARVGHLEDPVARLQAEAMALGLIASSFAKLNGEGEGGRASLPRAEQIQLARMEEFARAADSLPSLADMARAGGVSPAKMRRIFRAAHGMSVQSYVRGLRLNMARRALETQKISVAQAAELAGYGSAENFATAFRRMHGVSPSQARKQIG